MTSNKDTKAFMNIRENNVGTVYVNPNFNKPLTNCQTMSNNSFMHVNPKFSHLLPNIQSKNIFNNTRIHINPNFIRVNNVVATHGTTDTVRINSEKKKSEQIATKHTASPVAASMSRYSLVRHNGNKEHNLIPAKNTNTVKLGRYKSVPVNYFKNTLGTVKSVANCIELTAPDRSSSIAVMHEALPNVYESRFKFIKHNAATTNNTSKLPIVKRLPIVRKQMKSMNQQVRLKTTKGNYKKNNIPCPQFKKFGKCLRNTTGKCEFQHDKKHVSICRKFIKGLCHDPECLLSHELTAKKMPICHFYLNGICTKENCPYLHVKLNEKSKVCRDFLNGYCEKGTDCLNRHINVHENELGTGACIRKRYTFRRKVLKSDGKRQDKTRKENYHQETVLVPQVTSQVDTNILESSLGKETGDCRYYQEPIKEGSNNDSQSALLKPSRCKLGPLPSFIHF